MTSPLGVLKTTVVVKVKRQSLYKVEESQKIFTFKMTIYTKIRTVWGRYVTFYATEHDCQGIVFERSLVLILFDGLCLLFINWSPLIQKL